MKIYATHIVRWSALLLVACCPSLVQASVHGRMAEIQEQRKSAAVYSTDLSGYQNDLANYQASFDQYTPRLTAFNAQTTALNADVASYNAKCLGTPQTPDGFVNCMTLMNALNARQGTLAGQKSAFDAERTKLEQSKAALNTRQAELQQRSDAINARKVALDPK